MDGLDWRIGLVCATRREKVVQATVNYILLLAIYLVATFY